MKHWKMSRLLILCLLVLAFAMVASAQEAAIVGTITDPSGAAVPGVQITITNTETGLVRHMTSNDAGQYAMPDAPHRSLHRQSRSRRASRRPKEPTSLLQVGDRTRVDFALEIGATTESIKVEANPIAVKSDTGEVSNVITSQEVSQIATNGRSLVSLALLTPGTSNNTPGFQAPTSGGANSSISFNGQRQNHNLWLADGAEQSDRGGAGGAIIAPSIDAIAEFRVLTSNYSADYGLSSAGTITMVFKSGTKDFHASAWEFVRNDAFDANDFFRNKSGQPVRRTAPEYLRLQRRRPGDLRQALQQGSQQDFLLLQPGMEKDDPDGQREHHGAAIRASMVAWASPAHVPERTSSSTRPSWPGGPLSVCSPATASSPFPPAC